MNQHLGQLLSGSRIKQGARETTNLDSPLQTSKGDDRCVVLVVDLEALSDLSLGWDVVVGSEGQGSSRLGDGRVSSVFGRDLGVGEDGRRRCAGTREGRVEGDRGELARFLSNSP